MINMLHRVQDTQVVTHLNEETRILKGGDMEIPQRMKIQMDQNTIAEMMGVVNLMKNTHAGGTEIEEDPGDLMGEGDQWVTQDLWDPGVILVHRDLKDFLAGTR